VGAQTALNRALDKEYKRKAKEAREEDRLLQQIGVSRSEYSNMPPQEQRFMLGKAGKAEKDGLFKKHPDMAKALVDASIDKTTGLRGVVDQIILNDPFAVMPESAVRRAGPGPAALKRLANNISAREARLTRGDLLNQQWDLDSQMRYMKYLRDEAFYNDPKNRNHPLVRKRRRREDRARGLARKKQLRKLQNTPGTKEFEQSRLRRLFRMGRAKAETEAIDDAYYNDPANANDPLVAARREREAAEAQKILKSLPGTDEHRADVLAKLSLKDAEEAANEAITEDFITAQPGSRLAKKRARETPGTEEYGKAYLEKLKESEITADVREALMKDFIKRNPNSRLADTERENTWREKDRKRARRKTAFRKARRKVTGAAHLVKRTVQMTLMTMLATLLAGLAIASKTLRAVLDVGETVRKWSMADAALNFNPGTIQKWHEYATIKGWDKEALAKAGAEVYNSFGNVFNFTKADHEAWASLLGEAFKGLTSMITPNGDANVEGLMNHIMNTLIKNIDRGYAGVDKPDVGHDQAYSEIYQRLSALMPNMALMLSYMESEFRLAQSKDSSIKSWADWKRVDPEGVEHSMSNFSNFYGRTDLDPTLVDPSKTEDRQIQNTAARQAFDHFNNFVGTLSLLKDEILQKIAINTLNTAEYVRAVIVRFLEPFFPAFAAKEHERAQVLNLQSKRALDFALPAWKGAAEEAAREAGYTGDMDTLLEAVQKAQTTMSIMPLLNLKIPNMQVLINLLDNFSRLGVYSQGLSDLARVEAELAKPKEKQVPYIVTTEMAVEAQETRTQAFRVFAGAQLEAMSWADRPGAPLPRIDIVLDEKKLAEESRNRYQYQRAQDREYKKTEEDIRREVDALNEGIKTVFEKYIPEIRIRGDRENVAGLVMAGLVNIAQALKHENRDTLVDDLAGSSIDRPLGANAEETLFMLADRAMGGRQWREVKWPAEDYQRVANKVKDIANEALKNGNVELSERIKVGIWEPMVFKINELPYADISTERVGEPVQLPLWLPEGFREFAEDVATQHSAATALQAVLGGEIVSEQAEALRRSGVLTPSEDPHKDDQETVGNYITAKVGEVVDNYIKENGGDQGSAAELLNTILGKANDQNHIVAEAKNGDLVLNMYLNGKLENTATIKNLFDQWMRGSKVIDTWMQLGRFDEQRSTDQGRRKGQ
jgi:hypothetical protein